MHLHPQTTEVHLTVLDLIAVATTIIRDPTSRISPITCLAATLPVAITHQTTTLIKLTTRGFRRLVLSPLIQLTRTMEIILQLITRTTLLLTTPTPTATHLTTKALGKLVSSRNYW